tara:strand:- start:259 stop:411 length:153 start_codon:yes stop_codon:yes gene_type:complete
MGCLISKKNKQELSDNIIDTGIFTYNFKDDDIKVDNKPRSIYDESYMNTS